MRGVHTYRDPPATVILRHPSLSYLRNILTPELIELLNTTSEMTLFLPVDKAWEALPHYERLYLESKFATDDLTRIVNMHATEKEAKHVYYSESFSSSPNRKLALHFCPSFTNLFV